MKSHQHISNHEPNDHFTNQLQEAIVSQPLPPPDPALREALLKKLSQPAVTPVSKEPTLSAAAANRRRTFFQRAGLALASTAALALVAFLWQRPNLPMGGFNMAKSEPTAVRTAPKAANFPFDDDFRNFSSRLTPTGPTANNQAGEGEGQEGLLLKGRLEGNPAQDYRSQTWPKLKKHYGSGGPQMADAPFSHGATTGTVKGPDSSPEPTTASATESAPRATTRAPRDPAAVQAEIGPIGTPAPITSLPAVQAETGTVPSVDSIEAPSIGLALNGRNTAGNRPAGQPGYGNTDGDSKNPATYNAPAPSPQPAKPADPARPASGPVTFNDRNEAMRNELYRIPDSSGPTAGNGQGQPAGTTVQLPAGLKPALPGEPSDHRYYESAQKGKSENKEVDQLAAVEQEKLVKDVALVKKRGDELRQKFSRVVALSEDIKAHRAKLRSEDEVQLEQKKLADLEVAIRDVQDSERKYRAILPQVAGEQYAPIVENAFHSPSTDGLALSTFSIDVDTASYANARRFLNNGQLPPPDAVRIEELVNYFKYKYPQPKGDDPFSVNMEMADCPWHPGHKLLRVGLQGKEIHRAERPASNIVFLIDTSGSMTDENKLPLLKQAFTMLTSELGENDKVTIVTYAGNAGLKLEPTRGDQKDKIIAAIDSLQSGGSTHGSAGIQLAYEQAAATFIKGGTNKVILATDGDLNVGITDDASLVNLIKQKAESGVFLTVLGVGTGNLEDAKMERLADNGNGIYAYLDSVREARKVLVEEMSGSLVTIAKDVKIQIEFNPAQIQAYRLLGYENRILAHKDFNDDKKDAGEIGAGHCVTAFYEVVLADGAKKEAAADAPKSQEEELIYQRPAKVEKPALEQTEAAKNGDLLTLKLRYKQPEANESKLVKFPLKDKGGNFNSASADFQFASAVVAFGLALRNSEHRGSANLSAVAEIATAAIGEDAGGHRAEFLDLVRRAKSLRGE